MATMNFSKYLTIFVHSILPHACTVKIISRVTAQVETRNLSYAM